VSSQYNQRRKRHCMVVHAYYPIGETRVQREAEALVERGYDVDVICLRKPGDASTARYRGVQVYRLPVRRNRNGLLKQFVNYLHFFILAMFELTKLDQRYPYDAVQVHNLPDFLVFCALLPKLRGRAIILDLHDLMPEFYAGRFGRDEGSFFSWLVQWQEKLACRFADHVITVSEHWRQALVQRGVPPGKCTVVMNVADTDIFQPPEDWRAYLPRAAEFRLIYHGAIPERYGLDLVLRAIDRVRVEIPKIHFTIVGAGDHLPTLKQMTMELGLEDHVTFEKGRLAELLPEIIRTANVGVVPYRNDVFTDGLLPTKLMEYAAIGLPTIAARTTAIEAYFSDTLVEFFEPGDIDGLAQCIRMLHNSPERLAELAQGSKKFNQHYNWTKLGAEYVALVERLGNQVGTGQIG
jgi:glycosyltransferase involved in cell wall biosynthesis